ncbi:uncharacterized protein LOC112510863 [Cynara cardunculus var. scolymus]|uniref:uncharacterized protein LOC112510863 n=1 Tax=Cynara cardunculus var. scolymus TaxID=59895 RepID=UPI000D628DA9|nr:uncharacterized protein LOC112510863 [Cynara cardunculus var. scolymus]
MATTAAADDDSDRPPLRRDSVPVVDLRLLSQSELYSLSLSSDSSFDLNRGDDVVIPKINRSVFNESAGSRKQTYSRLRLASAESSATTKTTTLHRRTPHLRSSHTTSSNNINDPEQAENSQIIRMLKHLCKSDPNFQDVVENEDENDSNSVVPEFLNPENLGIKRKRGRPRKHENVVFLRPPTAKRIRNNTVKKVVVFDHERDREIVNDRGVPVNLTTLAGLEDPYGPEIRRRTVGMSTEDELLGFLRGLNGQWGSRRKKRRVVDAIEFGDVLPKGWRLSLCIKKKEGRVWLFCRRYISPSGQQFESCKEISTYLISVIGQENLDKPNHIDINSCDDNAFKGASVNAADLVLQEDIKRDGPINNPSSSSSCPVNNPSSSPPAPPLPTNCEEQVTMDIEDAMDVQIGDVFKCLKCSLIFEGKDNLLDHQVLAHDTERSQLGTAVTEWVIVEGGIFECQICHKTFSDRNQYNGHIGCHVKNEVEKTEPSLAPASELDCDPRLMTGLPNKEALASVSAGDNIEPASHLNYETNSGKLSNADELVHDLNIVSHSIQDGHIDVDRNIYIEESRDKLGNNCTINDEVSRTDQVPDIAVSQSGLLVDEVPLSVNESNRQPETSGEAHVKCIDDKLDCDLDQGISSGSFLLSPFPNKLTGNGSGAGESDISGQVLNQDAVSETGVTYVDSVHDKSDCILEQGSSGNCLLPSSSNEPMGNGHGVGKDIVGMAASVGVLNHTVSETSRPKSSICEEKGFGANMDMPINSTSDELISEKEKVVGGSSFGLFLDRFGLDKDGATVAKKLSTKATRSLISPSIDSVKAVNSESLISSRKQKSAQKGGLVSSRDAPPVDNLAHGTYNNVNKLSSGLASSRLDGQFDVRRNAFVSYGASGIEGVSTFGDENEFRSHPSLTSWQEEECENKNLDGDVSFPTMEEPRMQINSERRSFLSGGEQSCCTENVTEVPSNKSEEAKLDDFHIFRNNEAKRNESVASLGSSHDGLNRDVLDFNTKSNLEFCSLVPSENEQAFSFQDDVTCLYDRAMEECKQESSERGLLNHFSIADTSDDIFENKIYSTPLDGLKFDDDRDISSNELSLAFGNPHALYPDAIRVEQKKDLVSCSVVPSKIDEAFDVHTSLSMVNNSMVENLKAGRGSVGGLFNLSCNDKTSSFPNGGNTVYPGRAWEGMKSDEFKNSGNKFTTGFGSNHGQTHEVVPSGMWKTTGDGNQLQSGLSTPSHPQIQSPSSFHSFNIMSEKVGDGQFRLDERYNEGFGVSGMRSSRPEPVEFSFLTGRSQHNPHPLQGDSRVFSYNAGMEQQFDSSFWLGKNGMMPSTGGRNQITSVCAWCRNEFHLQPVHPGTQDGIGSLCPSCSAGMSGHVNML